MATVLVTGGTGYIGSHTVVELLNNGYEVVVVDNLSNSSREPLSRIERITGKSVSFYEVDCCDKPALSTIFAKHAIDGVIHFAGLKAVGESVTQPLHYYRTNLDATLTLCEVMAEYGVRQLVFSSSATVYNPDNPLPWSETGLTGGDIPHPYGKTKYMIEQMLGSRRPGLEYNHPALLQPHWRPSQRLNRRGPPWPAQQFTPLRKPGGYRRTRQTPYLRK
jgi:UDP-glucose 4-epimerase